MQIKSTAFRFNPEGSLQLAGNAPGHAEHFFSAQLKLQGFLVAQTFVIGNFAGFFQGFVKTVPLVVNDNHIGFHGINSFLANDYSIVRISEKPVTSNTS